jgi:molybdenum cofactor biosynthesis protein B
MADVVASQVRVLTVTISDLRKRHADETGKRLAQELALAGFTVVRHAVLADEPGYIRELVRSTATQNEADAIILSGGTGITPRDQTFEALDELFEKRILGFGEAFRRLAFDALGPRAMYFRASAGVYNQCPVYSLPGNAQAVVLAVRQLIAPTLAHAVEMAMGRETHTVGPASARADRGSSRDVSLNPGAPSDAAKAGTTTGT